MLQSLEIENFRCFHHSVFNNFGRVNLIGGMNNSGKTALLEAILLGVSPTKANFKFLSQVRNEDVRVYNSRPELGWVNWIYGQKKDSVIKIKSENFGSDGLEISMKVVDSAKYQPEIIFDESNKPVSVRVVDSSQVDKIYSSQLNIEVFLSPSNQIVTIQLEYKVEEDESLTWHSFGPAIGLKNEHLIQGNAAILVPAGYKSLSTRLAEEYNEAKKSKKNKSVDIAFKLIDSSIESLDVINDIEPRIYVFRKNEKPQPLNFFGDALNKIADLILRVINNPKCVLLIDEIENGIHYTNQQAFWEMLIKLAVANEVQIFSTSHSAEMIAAFQRAATKNNWEEHVRYIEMSRSKRSQEIIGAQRDMETLEYDLRTQQTYRGE